MEGGRLALADAKLPIDPALRLSPGRIVTAGIRPEAVAIVDGSGRAGDLNAIVEAVTPLNERTVLLLKAPSGWEFLASLPSSGEAIPEAGRRVRVEIRPAGLHLFDRETGRRIAPGQEG